MHLLFEFGMNSDKWLLNESHGTVGFVDEFVTGFMKDVQGQISATFANGCTVSHVYEGNAEKYSKNVFFKNYSITLITSMIKEERVIYSGGFNPEDSISEDEEWNVTCRPTIVLHVSAPSAIRMQRTIPFVLGHELTHAYNIYKYAQEYGMYSLRKNIIKTQNYTNIKNYSHPMYGQNVQAIADMLYTLNRMERSAYIAQLKQEMEADGEWITDAESAMDLIRSTESYEKFRYLEKNIDTILNIRYEPIQNEILSATNAIIRGGKRKPFSNWEQLRRYYSAVWETWKKKYLITASKIAYDISARNNIMMDGDIMHRKINIKGNESKNKENKQ